MEQDLSNPRPGFGIIVPGNEIAGCFNNQKKGSSISVEVHSWSMGFVACVAFSASGESPSLFCHFKANGRENYPSPMGISCNSIQVLSVHLWIFYLCFDYLKELKEWQHESFSNIELSFHSSERVKVKNCGVFLLYSRHTGSLQFSSYYYYKKIFPPSITRGSGLEKIMANRSRLLQTIEESRLSVIIFARDHTSLTLCFDELVNMIRFMSEMRPDTVFPVSYDAKQSKIDDQTGMYTIVFDKDEENCKDDAKVKRWMDILIGVVESWKRYYQDVWVKLNAEQKSMSIIEGMSRYQYQYFMLLGQPIWQNKRWPILWSRWSSQQPSRWSSQQRSWPIDPLQRFQTLESLLQQLHS